MRKSKKISVLLVVGLLFGLSNCNEDETTTVDFKVGLVTDVGRVNDGGFNQGAWEGGMRAVRDFGIQYDFAQPNINEEEYADQIQGFIAQEHDLIITVGFLLTDATSKIAAENPDFNFSIVDVDVDGNAAMAGEATPANLSGMIFRDDQGGYLAGVLAGGMMKESSGAMDKAVCVGGVSIPPVNRFCNAFTVAVQRECPSCTAWTEYSNTFATDATAAGLMADDLVDTDGADIIFAAAGGFGNDVIKAAAAKNVWVIGVDSDQWVTVFESGLIDGSDKVLTSAVKNVDEAVYQTIKTAYISGFTNGSTKYGVAENGISLAPYHEADADIPDAVKTRIKSVLDEMADGTLTDLGVDYDTGNITTER